MIEEFINTILKHQHKKHRHVLVDIVLINGNITLRYFRIYHFDKKTKTIKGMTWQEEYTFLREDRDPVYCILDLKEIKSLRCDEINIDFSIQEVNKRHN
jgi:hypothetical protein